MSKHRPNSRSSRNVVNKTLLAPGLAMTLAMTGCSSSNNDDSNIQPPEPPVLEDRAYYILPPGNFGGLPETVNSTDQLALYDALTPLRDNVTDADIEENFLREDFAPMGETTVEATGRPGTTILYDEFGVPHITGQTRDDLSYGAGWVTARDRGLLVALGRGPSRVAVADVPGINAFGLVLSAQEFIPSAATEQLVTDQVELIKEVYGELGEQIIADAEAYVAGYNAQLESKGPNPNPVTVNDVIATTAFIGSIFGAGGGSEASNADLLSSLIQGLGDGRGQLAWEDVMLFNDPEAPTTIDTTFNYGPMTGGPVTGSAVIDAGSIVDLDPLDPIAGELGLAKAAKVPALDEEYPVQIPAAGPPVDRLASNFLVINSPQSVNSTNMAVMGPQLGYYYPEIVMQMHLSAPGIEAQGAAVPGLSMYLLVGRTQDYSWSLTSANHDVRDVYVELLCNPDESEPTRDSLHYMFDGECIPFEIFDAGTLAGEPVRYPVSVHGPMIGTATSEGRPVALTRKRSTFGRDGLNLAALKGMTEGEASTPEAFFETANKFGFTFNWAYMSRANTAYFSAGYLPVRAQGLDRRLPTWGTGEYEWQGFLTQEQHPHDISGPSGRLLNWNNKSAPGFMHGDGTFYGSIHRVQLFDNFPEKVDLAGVVGVMNRAATEDPRSPAWPAISEVLHGADAPNPLAAQVVDMLDAWIADDAPRLDADNDGFYDAPAATIMDALFTPLSAEVMRPVFGDLTDRLDLGSPLNHAIASSPDGASYVDKDLRTLLGQDVQGKFALSYCGDGDLEACQDSLWQVVDRVAQRLVAQRGDDPTTWFLEGQTSGFAPNLISNRFRLTNRPTFQQVLEFIPPAAE